MKILLSFVALTLPLLAFGSGPARPVPVDYGRSAAYRWLQKPVQESRLLDAMESLEHWRLENTEQALGDVELEREIRHEGETSLKLTCPTTGSEPAPSARYFGFARLLREVSDEDWSEWNRVSFWVYPDMPGFKNISLLTVLHNAGSEPVPDRYGKMGLNYVLLENRRWNHVVWEVAHLPRKKVTAFEFQYRMQGHEPGASEEATFYFDRLELQRVDADYYEGWEVAPGRISYSHAGYLPGLRKTAFTSDLPVRDFQLVSEDSGQVAYEGRAERVRNMNGAFAVFDFTSFRQAGRYTLKAGDLRSQPFSIGADVWDESIWAMLNFFYAERCGTRIPGVHDVCHEDWIGMEEKGSEKIVINGGWHDAGDLSQGLKNTAQGTYALFSLAEALDGREDQKLRSGLLGEAKWGLQWVLKTRFPAGSRILWATHDRWTNGILGDEDDMIATARSSPAGSFMAARAEAIAARLLKESDPFLASRSRKAALLDWSAGQRFLEGSRAWERREVELCSLMGMAALELWKLTGTEEYAKVAIELAKEVLRSQQREFLAGLERPITGFLYRSPQRERILRYEHSSDQQAPLVFLTRLCRLFPEHEDWMDWYSFSALYSRFYVEEMAQMSAPYRMLASALHSTLDHEGLDQDHLFPGANEEEFREQVLQGVRVGEGWYVRRFPVWFVFRGNNGTLLSEAVGLAAAADLRRSRRAQELAQEQLMWVAGRNPFSQSTVFGLGYDYPPQYAAMFGDHLGATAVGIQTRHERDVPYWPTENCHNWKETWLHPAVRWLELMEYLRSPIESPFQDASATLKAADPESSVPGTGVGVASATWRSLPEGEVEIEVILEGHGEARLELRSTNFVPSRESLEVTLDPSGPTPVSFRGTVVNEKEPWVVLILPGGDLEARFEILGSFF